MTIEILHRATSRARLSTLAETQFGDMVKAVVDVERRVMAIGGEDCGRREQGDGTGSD